MTFFRKLSKSRAATLVPASILGLASVGCSAEQGSVADGRRGGETTEPGAEGPVIEGTTLANLPADELATIKIVRLAIDRGLVLGKVALADELNISLGEKAIAARYAASVDSGVKYAKPESKSCPFLQPPAGQNKNDCREIVSRSIASAYTQTTGLKAQNPLGTEFDPVREEAEFWFDQAIHTGIDNEAVLGMTAVRAVKACDEAPEPVADAFEAGVQRGRQLYIDQVNAELVTAGYSMTYPDAITPIVQCQANTALLAPARSRALADAPIDAKASPLCADYQPVTLEDVARRDDADRQFVQGIERGVADEHSLAEEIIFETVPCNVGDPLVLDIAGDGVDLAPLAQSTVRFDLYGVGSAIQVAWIRGDDAFLVLDRNGNGTVDDGRELFGNFVGDSGFEAVPSGFEHLGMYDGASQGGNGDGVINREDSVYAELRLFQDVNSDGVSQPHELSTLAELGVKAIRIGYVANHGTDSQLTHRSAFTRTTEFASRAGSASGDIYDAWLRHGRFNVGN